MVKKKVIKEVIKEVPKTVTVSPYSINVEIVTSGQYPYYTKEKFNASLVRGKKISFKDFKTSPYYGRELNPGNLTNDATIEYTY